MKWETGFGGAVNFDVDNSIASLVGFTTFATGYQTADKKFFIMGFKTIYVHFNNTQYLDLLPGHYS